MRLSAYTVTICLILSLACPARAEEDVWSILRAKDLLADAKAASVSGLCVAACALNVAQAAALVAGKRLMANPQERLEDYVTQDGRTSLGSLRVTKKILANEIPGLKFEISGKILRKFHSDNLGLDPVRAIELEDLATEPDEFKILFSEILGPNLKPQGGFHAQIVSQAEGKTIQLVEPYYPYEDWTATKARRNPGARTYPTNFAFPEPIKKTLSKGRTGIAPYALLTIRILNPKCPRLLSSAP